MQALFLPLFILLSACSLQKMALRSSTPLLEKSIEGLMQESDWEYFSSSSAPNLKFLELLYLQDLENLRLLTVLIKGYAGHAFGVHETLALKESLAGNDESPAKKSAISFYTRALDYGLYYLEQKGVHRNDLLAADEEILRKKLNTLDEDDATAMLYTAQSWGSLINLQKENIALVSQIPTVKAIFDRVCELKPEIDHNICDIFYASYEASRPKMLGGNPAKGEELFLSAIKKNPHNLLLRVSYIQYSVIPAMDEEKYEREATILRGEFSKFTDNNRDTLENLSPYKSSKKLNLYNAIALKRFEMMEQLKKKIF
jgi:hypothetical protein